MSGHTALIVGTPWFCVVADEVMGKDADGEVFVVAQLNPLQEMPDEVTAHHARLIAASPTMHDYIARRAAGGDTEAAAILEAVHGSR